MPAAYPALRRLLFRLDPESAHGLAMAALRVPGFAAAVGGRVRDRRLAQTLLGRNFPNPVGLAAGFDKDALALAAWPALGFGFAEVGTVTPEPQPGNPRPRLFRHSEAESLQNAMGFNNAGLDAMRRRLARSWPAAIPIGVNLGKNRATPPERALGDYERLLAGLGGLCDYLVINLSSPNTPGLRDLQNEDFVAGVLAAAARATGRPVLVKLSPDLGPERAAEIAEAAVGAGAAGIIATNTTTDYSLLPGARDFGGLSGRVLAGRSFAVLQAIAARLYGRAVLVSVGGVDSGAEAYRRLRAGASLVQVYTALVYRGPRLAARINRELLTLLERDGLGSVGEAVGAGLARGACAARAG
jgi:dihydroorotate dehydrogenase